jgi:hypothetical protein
MSEPKIKAVDLAKKPTTLHVKNVTEYVMVESSDTLRFEPLAVVEVPEDQMTGWIKSQIEAGAFELIN